MSYITKEDWNQEFVPKLNSEKEFRNEFIQIVKIHNILIELILLIINDNKQSLNMLKQKILYSSMIYYYKYILFNRISHEEITNINRIIICSSCIFLSLKANNINIHTNYISEKILSNLDSKHIKYTTDELNNHINKMEYNILYSIGFDISIDNPYLFLNPLISYFEKKGTEKKIMEKILELFNEYIKASILFPLYLYYTSYDLAISCISLVKKAKFEFIDIDDFIKENKLEIDKNNVDQCSLYILKIYETINKKSDIEENNNKDGNDKDNNGEYYSIFDAIASIRTNTNYK